MPEQRFFRPQRIYHPDIKKFTKNWLNDSNSDLTRDRIMFRAPCGEEGVPMFLLIDKNRSEHWKKLIGKLLTKGRSFLLPR